MDMAKKKKNIMIVDDDDDLRNELSEIMREENYEVEAFSDGREALAKITELHPHVLLLDIRMPKINGIQMLDRLRSRNAIDGTKVILITGFYDQQKCKRILQIYDADSYLLKPFDPEDLIKRVETITKEN
ncbi:MAG: response regulator [Candidatus Omnitrophica bacterium]|nr:response regulator [Candidatus Omnitrophota bacterium]MCF7894359.1 response regulator [Candidatus Omnitrophota bacterium]